MDAALVTVGVNGLQIVQTATDLAVLEPPRLLPGQIGAGRRRCRAGRARRDRRGLRRGGNCAPTAPYGSGPTMPPSWLEPEQADRQTPPRET
ncbi:hypothetical protein [Pseudonocardia broussonetiae]|uniref:Uncharacterized protein n=1 Tax=Pseudonocardia broussonetiae TaxID=2736640 RepID=A0A6M6JN84_9PSEU|nr:hypothetical protein [Pseudonocardia broussonetiae]QJY47899.1 hypothetical protein HOP40_20585 [Pseudonocardia broussonetiae]